VDNRQPFISIVVPTHERPGALAGCLEALAELDYPCDRFEVIVVDDGSQTSLGRLVDAFRARLTVTLLRQERAGPAAARNTGARHAQGEFIAFTDDDCHPARGWLDALSSRFQCAPQAAIGGQTINGREGNRYCLTSSLIVDYIYHYHLRANSPFFASNNFAVPTEAFRAVGGFDPAFPLAAGEDREFCARWLRQGRSMLFAPEAVVYHAQDLSFRGFWRQQSNYGRAARFLRRLRVETGKGRGALEPMSFYVDLLRYPLSRGWNWQALQLSALVCISQLAVASGFLLERSHLAHSSR
jgi:GT2 family glycosyltransferase